MFFSTFEELKLPIRENMERAGVTKLYEHLPTPCLYVAPGANRVGRIPLIPLFLAGNSTPTIQHMYSKHEKRAVLVQKVVIMLMGGLTQLKQKEARHALVYARPCMYVPFLYWYVRVYHTGTIVVILPYSYSIADDIDNVPFEDC